MRAYSHITCSATGGCGYREKKMHEEVIISGFGGQGVLFAGQLLAYSGVADGLHVTWIPSYGPEMRGGTAHCEVVISSEEIGSPLTAHPTAVIILNSPSMEKYEPLVKAGRGTPGDDRARPKREAGCASRRYV
jgi:Pyruvate/2-oxoacid:ferredoxin oxidoreductase gamma subunit